MKFSYCVVCKCTVWDRWDVDQEKKLIWASGFSGLERWNGIEWLSAEIASHSGRCHFVRLMHVETYTHVALCSYI